MRVAVIGAAGQLGTDICRTLRDVVPLTHTDLEITDPASIDRSLTVVQPQIVINSAAYNLVDQAEDEFATAFAVNAQGPRLLAQWCRRNGALLVHVSTDYVFGNEIARDRPFSEEDCPQPCGVYGQSKLAGEMFVRSECPRHLVIRTCGLYGRAATKTKGNFVNTILRLAGERDELRVVNDQHCTPSYTHDVADMIAALIGTQANGTYHVTNGGQATWFDVAQAALRLRGLTTRLIPIPASDYPTKARRPYYSVLSTKKAEIATGRRMPEWQDALARYLNRDPE